MFEHTSIFSGFSVNDVAKAREFYGTTLGLDVGGEASEASANMINLHIDAGHVLIYGKPDHTPANYTILNFAVDDITKAVTQLADKGVEVIRYDGLHQDELGISRGLSAGYGPDIAWFNDPAGNILAVLQQSPSK